MNNFFLYRHLTNILLLVYQLGICCVYVMFIGENLKSIVDHFTQTETDVRMYMLFTLLPIILINWVDKSWIVFNDVKLLTLTQSKSILFLSIAHILLNVSKFNGMCFNTLNDQLNLTILCRSAIWNIWRHSRQSLMQSPLYRLQSFATLCFESRLF